MSATIGRLEFREERIDMPFGDCRHEIVGARLEGPPLVILPDRFPASLPRWAVSTDGRMAQIGDLLLQRTDTYDYDYLGYYWWVVNGDHAGYPYWLYWQVMQRLARMWQRLILTLAVWGLAAWPQSGTRPSWDDVKRRWCK